MENTPWSKTINQIFSKNIKDFTIKKYHKFEKMQTQLTLHNTEKVL